MARAPAASRTIGATRPTQKPASRPSDPETLEGVEHVQGDDDADGRRPDDRTQPRNPPPVTEGQTARPMTITPRYSRYFALIGSLSTLLSRPCCGQHDAKEHHRPRHQGRDAAELRTAGKSRWPAWMHRVRCTDHPRVHQSSAPTLSPAGRSEQLRPRARSRGRWAVPQSRARPSPEATPGAPQWGPRSQQSPGSRRCRPDRKPRTVGEAASLGPDQADLHLGRLDGDRDPRRALRHRHR